MGPPPDPDRTWQQRYLARFYDPGRGWVDGTTEFHRLCADVIPKSGLILEMGAGRSNSTSRFLATLGPVHGLDPDPAVLGNDALTGAQVLEAERFPGEDASFDACSSNYVLEHVRHPREHLREVFRVLRPGGAYVFRTANRSHYVTLVSRWTPHAFHRLVVKRLTNAGADAADPFPTVYAANSPGQIRGLAAAAGLQVESLRLVEKEPSYGMASRALFLAFMAYERAVNAGDTLARLRSNIFAVLRKPARG
jgi:SAM-dependent methyltransferase